MLKFKRLIKTVSYLKWIQVYMRIFYLLRQKIRERVGFRYPFFIHRVSYQLQFLPLITSPMIYEKGKFCFLNISKSFTGEIDWNYQEYGKLWTYNLSYFDFLHQENMSTTEGVRLMYDFIDQILHVKDGLEAFPISLRGVNWIKFMTLHNLKDQKIDDSLYAQYYILMDNLEYHLLGNHLLENAFSLLFGAYYFQDECLHVKAKEILFEQLEEQILGDGAHFELSPMYHQIMLFRVLDCINLLQNNRQKKDDDLLAFLQEKASVMLSWLKKITFEDGSIPLLNDSANTIAPTSSELFKYAKRLKLHVKEVALKESGYRKFKNENYECIVDIGQIGPDYIPGHAHADTFNFELHVKGKPFIVDTGLSTYEKNARRMLERSTASHNTVELNGMNQSDVWGGFRVGNRAYISNIEETSHSVKATHDGYKKYFNALHVREFIFKKNTIHIVDEMIADEKYEAISRIHFHPDVDEEMIYKHLVLDNLKHTIIDYRYAPEFNLRVKAKVLELEVKVKKLPFANNLEIKVGL